MFFAEKLNLMDFADHGFSRKVSANGFCGKTSAYGFFFFRKMSTCGFCD